MYIHNHGSLTGRPVDDLKYYKEDVSRFSTLTFRRANRFVLLALAGACRCAHGQDVGKDTAVYLTTENGNLSDTEAVLHQIHHKHEFPMPYNFINTMSNTASFYVAQTLGLLGRNITFSSKQLSFERGLELLRCDMTSGTVQEALIGGVDEAYFSDAPFEAKFHRPYSSYEMIEGSSWLLIRARKENALGRIRAVESPGGFSEAKAWLGRQTPTGPIVLAWGLLVEADEREAFRRLVPDATEFDYIKQNGYFDSAPAAGIAAFMESWSSATLVHINKDFRGRYVVLVVEKY